MAEKPILFNGEMVKAILDGRKTMTRRALNRNKLYNEFAFDDPRIARGCPYGAPGDTLWVRETFKFGHAPGDEPGQGIALYFDECGNIVDSKIHPDLDPKRLNWCRHWKKKPSIFMPRWASRITLRITDVRVERLQEISEADTVAEGLTSWSNEKQPGVTHYGIAMVDEVWSTDPRLVFSRLWDSINAKRGYGWGANPWVWVVSFAVDELRKGGA